MFDWAGLDGSLAHPCAYTQHAFQWEKCLQLSFFSLSFSSPTLHRSLLALTLIGPPLRTCRVKDGLITPLGLACCLHRRGNLRVFSLLKTRNKTKFQCNCEFVTCFVIAPKTASRPQQTAHNFALLVWKWPSPNFILTPTFNPVENLVGSLNWPVRVWIVAVEKS